jgi:hypothetical protein
VLLRYAAVLLLLERVAVLADVRDDATAPLVLEGVLYLVDVNADPVLRRYTGPLTVVRYVG